VGNEDDDIVPVSSGTERFSPSTGLAGDVLVEFSGASDKLNSLDSTGPLLIFVGGCVNGRVPPNPTSDSFFDSVSADIERCSIIVFGDFGVWEMGVAPGKAITGDGFEFNVEVVPVDFSGS